MDGHGQLGLAHHVAQAHPPGLHGHDPHLPLLHGAVGAGALGCLVLCGSLVLGACSSSGSGAGGTIPPASSAGAASGSAASGGASSGASVAPTTLDAQALTDASIGYYVDLVPQGLDATQTQALLGFLAYDRATWEAYRKMDGDLSAVEASTTGEELESYRENYRKSQAAGEREVGTARMVVSLVEMQSGSEAVVDACADQTQIKRVSSNSEELPKPSWQHKYSYLATVRLVDGAWKVASLQETGVDVC